MSLVSMLHKVGWATVTMMWAGGTANGRVSFLCFFVGCTILFPVPAYGPCDNCRHAGAAGCVECVVQGHWSFKNCTGVDEACDHRGRNEGRNGVVVLFHACRGGDSHPRDGRERDLVAPNGVAPCRVGSYHVALAMRRCASDCHGGEGAGRWAFHCAFLFRVRGVNGGRAD